MVVGDIIHVVADVWDPEKMTSQRQLRRATVIYIHPGARYYTVQYDNGIRESFLPEIAPADRPHYGFHVRKRK